jgi:trehalose 6-phosphate phosphatase
LATEELLAQTLPAPSLNWAVFVDVDCTLPDIAIDCTATNIADGAQIRAALAMLHGLLKGAVALASERSIAELDRWFAPMRFPAAGQHGAELRLAAGGEIMRWPRSPHLQKIREELEVLAASLPGVVVEDRGRILATHVGAAARRRGALYRAIRGAVAASDDLRMTWARTAFEIRPRGFDEGIAVEWLMRTSAFRNRLPIFIGDPRTDSEGFAAVKAFGGLVIGIRAPSARHPQSRLVSRKKVGNWIVQSAAILSERQG